MTQRGSLCGERSLLPPCGGPTSVGRPSWRCRIAKKIGQKLSDFCFARGLNTRALGGHVMAFTPPLIISDAEIDLAVDIFSEGLDELYGFVRREGLLG